MEYLVIEVLKEPKLSKIRGSFKSYDAAYIYLEFRKSIEHKRDDNFIIVRGLNDESF